MSIVSATRNFTWGAIVVCAFLSNVHASAEAVLRGEKAFRGQVMSTSGGELEILAGGEAMRFAVSEDAVITVDDQQAELGQLTRDHIAEVTAKRDGEGWTATRIVAHTQRGIVRIGD